MYNIQNDIVPELILYYLPLSIPLLVGLVAIFYAIHFGNYWISGYGFFGGLTFSSQFYHYEGDINYFPIWIIATLSFVAVHSLCLTIQAIQNKKKQSKNNTDELKDNVMVFVLFFLFTCFILALFVRDVDIQL